MKTTRPVFEDFASGKEAIAVIGLGYVGLPLAVRLARQFRVIGFDINARRVAELEQGQDRTRELTREQLQAVRTGTGAAGLTYAAAPEALGAARLLIVTVPTPIDDCNRPDLTPLVKASTLIGRQIQPGTTVVYESTVYPGCTEEDCLPLIEKESGLKRGTDFFAGYSPERINPGDKKHTVDRITKVVSGDNAATAELLRGIYGAVITAGVFVAESIRVAEAAKVIENTQRDLNIALMNELSVVFGRLGIDTSAVLAAAGTKWNFLPFRPGLVGGHCIGVDPYYLTHKAEQAGYHPQVILAGRHINDQMAAHVAQSTLRLMIKNGLDVARCRIGVLGVTFKENCPDTRNSKVVDLVRELAAWGATVVVTDPLADAEELREHYGLTLGVIDQANPVDALVVAVGHTEYAALGAAELRRLCRSERPVLADVKSLYERTALADAGFTVFRL